MLPAPSDAARRSIRRLVWSLQVALVAGTVFTLPVAADQCRTLGTGVVECRVSGGSQGGRSGDPAAAPRFLWIGHDAGVGPCWYWSSRPGGYDPQNPTDALAISTALRDHPACPAPPGDEAARAWEIFRSFRLEAPLPEITPDVGVTGLPTFVGVAAPAPVAHSEVLPDGRVMRVEASVTSVAVDWGDGHRSEHAPGDVGGYPGGSAVHTYRHKTCTSTYRTEHPAGMLCHPTLDAYDIEVTFVWAGSYSIEGPWIVLGVLELGATRRHDVDELVGVRHP